VRLVRYAAVCLNADSDGCKDFQDFFLVAFWSNEVTVAQLNQGDRADVLYIICVLEFL
jgi:hypothetical protein